MISIGKLTSGPAAAAYYIDQVANGRDDYYAGKREEPGRWIGAGAEALGWSGVVDADEFGRLLAGAGVRRIGEGGVAGFDLTFRAPKSVSVLWAIGDPELAGVLRAAHGEAVTAALGFLEREGVWARRGAGGLTQIRGLGFVGAAFTHYASRAGDPLLHTHVVVGNLTLGDDGRWTALDARHLYRLAKTAGYLYQAELRLQITDRLGLEWSPVENGVADLAGVPRGVIEHFSQRRAEILAHLAEHDAWSPQAAQVAALQTRRAKNEPALDRQREDWRSRAAEHGLTPQDVAELLAHGRGLAMRLPVSVVIESLTEHASTFTRPDVLRALAGAQQHGASITELERMADVILTDGCVVQLTDLETGVGLVEARFTTRELLAIEQDLLDTSIDRIGTGVAVVDPDMVAMALSGRSLTDEQTVLVAALCGDGDGVAVIRAAAGTGKTFALDAAREAWQAADIEVEGCALSARAALELRDQTAIRTHTIAQLTYALDHGQLLGEGGVLLVDEAGMVGTRDLHKLAVAARDADAKLVLVGDDRQLPEIQAGGAFRGLADRLRTVELHEVQRQNEAWDRAALQELRDGEVERWARAYRDRGQITIAATNEQTRAAMVNDWSRAPGDALMIAARRSDVRDLNQRARELRQARGDLGRDELEVDDRAFAVGDRVVATRNDRQLEIVNGQRGTVTRIDKDRKAVTVEIERGREVQLPDRYLQEGNLDHGYAITAHRAQGITVDRTFVLGSEQLSREWGYTAMSRHRDEARFYVTRDDIHVDRDLPPDRDPVVDGITQLIDRSDRHELAIDALPEIDRDALEQERRRLRAQLDLDRQHAFEQRHRDREVARAQELLDDALQRQAQSQQARDQIAWHKRRERADHDRILEGNRRAVEHHTTRLDEALNAQDHTHGQGQAWLDQNEPQATRLLAIETELANRDTIDQQADRTLHAYHREHGSLDPTDAQPELDRQLAERDRWHYPSHDQDFSPDLDYGPDLGPDLDFGP